MPLSDEYSNRVLNGLLGDLRMSETAATVYVALLSAAPTAGGGGTELTGGGYARVAVPNTSAQWPAAALRSKKNANAINFAAASAAWAAVVAVGVYDAGVAGNLIAWMLVSPSIVTASGEVFTIPANSLVLTVT